MGLMPILDRLKFKLFKLRNRAANEKFKKLNPDIALPPDYLLFESFKLDYNKYYYGGIESAKWVKEKVEKYKTLKDITVLDWGCGPARITRHLPEILDASCSIYGTDYNEKTISWCKSYIKNINFKINTIHPPLHYNPEYFDLIIGISIFTHLSEENHLQWLADLSRVLKPGGILFITTHGALFKSKMTESEVKKFDAGNLVVRADVTEGHRIFAAFQPVSYMVKLTMLFFEVLEHYEGKKMEWGKEQDYWVLKKK